MLNNYQLCEGQVAVNAPVESHIAESAVATLSGGARLSVFGHLDLKKKVWV